MIDRGVCSTSFSLLPPPKTSSHRQTIFNNKMSDMHRLIVSHLREKRQTLPGPPAERSDYEAWARDFLKLLVSRRKSRSPPSDTSVANLRRSLERCDRRDGCSDRRECHRRPRGRHRRVVGSVGGPSRPQNGPSSKGRGGGKGSGGAQS